MVGSRIVVTGGTSGLGFATLKHLVRQCPNNLPPPYHILLLARDPTSDHASRARDEMDEMNAMLAALPTGEESSSTISRVDLLKGNLTDLAVIRTTSEKILTKVREGQAASLKALDSSSDAARCAFRGISPGRVDLLLLNAGAANASQVFHPETEEKGKPSSKTVNSEASDDPYFDAKIGKNSYEETILVNHVAQIVLLSKLLPVLLPAESSNDSETRRPARIVFTGSALHHKLRDLKELDPYFSPAKDESGSPASGQWNLLRTYGASKFVQMLGVQQVIRLLQQRLHGSERTQIEVVVVQPGFIPSTALSRHSPWSSRLLTQTVLPLFSPVFPFITSLSKGADTVLDACVCPFDRFSPAAGETDVKPAQEAGPVAFLAVGKDRHILPLDKRTEDEALSRRWWPAIVEEDWSSS